ncbi:MAG: Transglutaminase-like superfamily [Solirubrobacteraceae bacterium]|jgi:hypothetical protein|nr:Transglutaminase-like superfamily [Solirubrobacteraceae bacterium]
MTSQRTFPSKLALSAEIVVTYARTRWLLRRHDLPGALGALRSRTNGRGADGEPAVETGRGLGHAVGRALSPLPADSRCLMRSLVLSGLLDRRGIANTLVIGVRPGERFGAHAWVEVAGQPVLDPVAGHFGRLVEL